MNVNINPIKFEYFYFKCNFKFKYCSKKKNGSSAFCHTFATPGLESQKPLALIVLEKTEGFHTSFVPYKWKNIFDFCFNLIKCVQSLKICKKPRHLLVG